MKKIIPLIMTIVIAIILGSVLFTRLNISSADITIVDETQQCCGNKLITGQSWDINAYNFHYESINLNVIRTQYGVHGNEIVQQCKDLAMNRQYSMIGIAGGYYGYGGVDIKTYSIDEQQIPCSISINGNTYSSDGEFGKSLSNGNYTITVQADGYKPTKPAILECNGGWNEITVYMIPISQPQPTTSTFPVIIVSLFIIVGAVVFIIFLKRLYHKVI